MLTILFIKSLNGVLEFVYEVPNVDVNYLQEVAYKVPCQ